MGLQLSMNGKAIQSAVTGGGTGLPDPRKKKRPISQPIPPAIPPAGAVASSLPPGMGGWGTAANWHTPASYAAPPLSPNASTARKAGAMPRQAISALFQGLKAALDYGGNAAASGYNSAGEFAGGLVGDPGPVPSMPYAQQGVPPAPQAPISLRNRQQLGPTPSIAGVNPGIVGYTPTPSINNPPGAAHDPNPDNVLATPQRNPAQELANQMRDDPRFADLMNSRAMDNATPQDIASAQMIVQTPAYNTPEQNAQAGRDQFNNSYAGRMGKRDLMAERGRQTALDQYEQGQGPLIDTSQGGISGGSGGGLVDPTAANAAAAAVRARLDARQSGPLSFQYTPFQQQFNSLYATDPQAAIALNRSRNARRAAGMDGQQQIVDRQNADLAPLQAQAQSQGVLSPDGRHQTQRAISDRYAQTQREISQNSVKDFTNPDLAESAAQGITQAQLLHNRGQAQAQERQNAQQLAVAEQMALAKQNGGHAAMWNNPRELNNRAKYLNNQLQMEQDPSKKKIIQDELDAIGSTFRENMPKGKQAAAAGGAEIPVGATAVNKKTGERKTWDGEKWVTAPTKG